MIALSAIGLAISAAIVNVLRHAARDIHRRLMDRSDPARLRWAGHRLHVDADVVLDGHRLFHPIPRLADALAPS